MPPRRSTSVGAKAGAKGKKRSLLGAAGSKSKLQRKNSSNFQLREAIEDVKTEARTKQSFSPDKRLAAIIGDSKKFTVYDDYSCTLNQTNIGQNNNKFYLIQLIEVSRKKQPYICYTRWGRVGEEGQYKCEEFCDLDQAIKAFRGTFKSKTKNDWNNRLSFTAFPKKYVLLEMADEASDEDEDFPDSRPNNSLCPKSKLDYRTQIMIKLIFSDQMFLSNMLGMNIDVKKMPLGKLSKLQIVKGLEYLLEIENAIKTKKNYNVLMELSSKFYTIIPHDFGRSVPEIIQTQAVVDTKKDNMMTLGDIELAQSLQDRKRSGRINEIDENYGKLKCELEWIPKTSKEYKIIEKYATADRYKLKGTLLDVWRVDRDGETKRMSAHKKIQYRKLLWHGTNIAVIAAILKAGLRIMPHSGGRVGRGIYFASEFTKSMGFMRRFHGEFENEKNIGFMFLAEVALGNMKEITDGSCCQATAAPKGCDSIVARGVNEPDQKQEITKKFDNHDVIIPYGTPKKQKEFENSGYWQSEYLVYKESQAKIRYLLKFSFQ